MDYLSRRKLITVGLAAALVLFGGSSQLTSGTRSKATKAVPAREKDLSKYVGAESCKACHEEIFKRFEPTPHWKTMLDTRRGAEWQGCEACHGPGAEHVAAGGDKTKIFNFRNVSASKISERCLECHEYGEENSNYAPRYTKSTT